VEIYDFEYCPIIDHFVWCGVQFGLSFGGSSLFKLAIQGQLHIKGGGIHTLHRYTIYYTYITYHTSIVCIWVSIIFSIVIVSL
jgi:hypothetical protein